MSKLAFFMMVGIVNFAWAGEEMTVQVINAVHEKSITREFDAKLKESGLEIHKKIENARYVVTLGAFHNEKSAQPALKKARTIVAKDAFVRPVNRDQTAQTHTSVAAQPVTHASVVQPAVTNVQEHPTVVAAVEAPKAMEPLKTIEVAKPIEAPKVVAVPVAPAVIQETKQSSVVVHSECDKKELRKDAFAEALNYYRTSPYHRFEPTGIRQ